MRLIDANKLFDFIQKEKAWKQDYTLRYRYDKGKYDAYYEMLDIIKEQPTIEAEPVVHGHWIDQDSDCEDWHIHQYECSKCGMGDQHNSNVNVPYCWFCGAKMDEDKCEI